MAMPHYPDALLQRAAKIRLVGFDVDGTLTDGRLHYASDGHETKSFHVQDGMGLVLLREAGIELALVSARISPLVAARGSELKIAHVHVGERSKLACMQRIAAGMGIGMDAVAFMGDDLPDLATLRAHWVAPRNGCEGAARDACDLILQAQGRLEGILAHGEHP